MGKQRDDNDRFQAGEVFGFLDDVEPVEPSIPPPPASGPVARLLSAAEAMRRIDAVLRSPSPFVGLRSTTGAGKSAATRLWLRDVATLDEPAIVAVPTHALAAQTAGELQRLGVGATAPMGVARVRLPLLEGQSEAPACVHHEAADLLARTGARPREELCKDCPERTAYQGREGSECPAYLAGAEREPVAVLQHTVLAAVLRHHTGLLTMPPPANDARKAPRPARLVVVDELPALSLHSSLEGVRRQYQRARLAEELRADARERVEPVLLAVLRAVDAGAPDGASLRALLDPTGERVAEVEALLADARTLDGAAFWHDSFPTRLAHQAMHPSTRAHALERLAVVARFSSLFDALVDAAHHPDVPVLRVEGEEPPRLVTLARWARYVGPYLAAGGRVRLLDATAPTDALRALWGELLELHVVDVADAPGVERRVLAWPHAARSRHTLGALLLADELRGPLRRLAELVAERGARSVGILTHKPVADALRGWLHDREADPSKPTPAWCPDEFAALVASGVELRPGHYFAQRGLDTWAACGVLATLGDPWPNLGAVRAEAAAIGIEPEAWGRELARAELVQAWGRARTVHRTTPVLVVHLGAPVLAPDASWAPQWAGVEVERPARGRPRSVTLKLSDALTWPGERARLGLSARQHARALGLSWTTYFRRDREASGTVDEASEETAENKPKDVVHNPPQQVSEGVTDTPSPSSSLIPVYEPPDSAGFVSPDASAEPSPPLAVLHPAPVESDATNPASGPPTSGAPAEPVDAPSDPAPAAGVDGSPRPRTLGRLAPLPPGPGRAA